MKLSRLVVPLFAWFLALTLPAWAATANYDFDNCSPRLTPGMSTPLNQTCNGIYAHFSSTHDGYLGGGYSIQTDGTTGWHMSQFSANYLVPNGLDPGRLDISFSQVLTAITFTFATADFQQVEVPTTIQLDAYMDSTLVGSQQAHGTYGSDTMPMGTLTFDSGGRPFNRVEVWIPWQPLGSTDVLLDNIVVTPGGSVTRQFLPTVPCRLVDTRQSTPIAGNSSRDFVVPQLGCGIPGTAVAYSLNVTAVPRGRLDYLTIWPAGAPQPYVSTLNSSDGRTKANAAIVPAGSAGAVSVFVTNTSDVILDINGYFLPGDASTLAFYPLTPCRVVDTREPNFPQGLGQPHMANGEVRNLPILTSGCLNGVSNPKAYSMNVTVVPNPSGTHLNYLTVWPSDQPQPVVSTLNNPTATVVANAAIVPAAANGDIKVFAYNSTEVVMDINGYFAPPGQNGLSFYNVTPCRVYDSRANGGQPFRDTRVIDTAGSQCGPPANAGAYVLNATVAPPARMPYLTLWPDSQQIPVVSTLNAYDGFITSNMAIVPNANGSIDAYADGLTHLIMDISGYFAP